MICGAMSPTSSKLTRQALVAQVIRTQLCINLTTPPRAPKEETITESILQNTMQTFASEFKGSREPKIQKFRQGGTSSGALLIFKSWMQDIECTIKDPQFKY